MNLFIYDKTFEGLLTAVFDAYFRKTFPDMLLSEGDVLPLFYDESFTVHTDEEKSGRVWRGLQKKLSVSALSSITWCWLSELPEVDMLLFRYIRKAIDAPRSIETNFGDPDVLELAKIWKKVDWERLRMLQFVRFQKAADGTFFAAFEPRHNASFKGGYENRTKNLAISKNNVANGFGNFKNNCKLFWRQAAKNINQLVDYIARKIGRTK